MKRSRLHTPRRGTVIMVMLVCLVVLTLLSGTVIRLGMELRKQGDMAERQLQAQWLAESGLERAAARLAADENYAGETWLLSAQMLDDPRGAAGRITIEVAAVEGQASARQVRSSAVYGHESEWAVRFDKQVVVTRSLSP